MIQITPRKSITTVYRSPWNADGYRLKMGIEDVDLSIRKGLADWDSTLIRCNFRHR